MGYNHFIIQFHVLWGVDLNNTITGPKLGGGGGVSGVTAKGPNFAFFFNPSLTTSSIFCITSHLVYSGQTEILSRPGAQILISLQAFLSTNHCIGTDISLRTTSIPLSLFVSYSSSFNLSPFLSKL